MARREQRIVSTLSVVLVLLATFLVSSDALAANLHDPSGSFTGLLDLVKNSSAQWDERLYRYAMRLFWSLALIQFMWTFIPLVFRQADFAEIVGELVRFILVICFFWALLLFSTDWAEAVVNSFRQAGAVAAGLGDKAIRPGDIFGSAIELANTISDVDTINPITAMTVSLAGCLVLICFAFIAAFMGVTIVESYVVINASVIFMGFGATQWTREYALAIVRYCVAVGAKLFVLTLIVGLIVDSAKQWQAAYQSDDASMWTMVGLAFVCAYFAKTIPELVAGMISGTSMGGGSSLGGMAAAGAAGAAAAIATIATAGAAAPAAAGIMGAASSAGGAAGAAGGAATGGLAGAINSSFAGASSAGSGAASMGSAASSSVGASTGGASAAKGATSASSAGSRVGGSTANAGPSAPSTPSSNGVQQAAKQAAKAGQGDDDSKGKGQAQPGANTAQAAPESNSAPRSAPSSPAQSAEGQGAGVGGRQVAEGLTRGLGLMSAMAVPGMESTAGLSLGSGQPQPVPNTSAEDTPSMAPSSPSEPENVIRPAEATPASDNAPKPGTKGEE
ncbi:conjugal transfer protein TrbL [Pseudomonas oryzihabitans]|uniref:P-type conjugative transfer protein TrbL n=1 Tax=Pseudomonas oryzihabitans TaxID=47885 RepID=UPI0005C95BFB|nr:P-type conjugative transfer protein TrbL [Pseudomonas oryzihabitans]KIZ48466.1 conjugal transfer protein TrbL [Pseudomonas oryzihabitans]